jgi:hypothetical protein
MFPNTVVILFYKNVPRLVPKKRMTRSSFRDLVVCSFRTIGPGAERSGPKLVCPPPGGDRLPSRVFHETKNDGVTFYGLGRLSRRERVMAARNPASTGSRAEAKERALVEAAQKDPGRFAELYEMHF